MGLLGLLAPGVGMGGSTTVPLAPLPTGPIVRVSITDGVVGRVRLTDSIVNRPPPAAGPTPWDLVTLDDWDDMTWDEIEAITLEILFGFNSLRRVRQLF